MRLSLRLLSLAVIILGASLSNTYANSIPVKGGSSYGQGSNSAFWDLGTSPISASGLTGTLMIDCPNQDLSGGSCSSGDYSYIFQINSAPADAVLNFTGITELSTTSFPGPFGFVSCDPANTVVLCSNTDSTTLNGLNVTTNPGTGTLSFDFTGAFPTFSAVSGTGNGGLTIYIDEQNQNNGPQAPQLSLGGTVSAAPEPGNMVLLGTGLLALAGTLRRRSKHSKNVAA